MSINKDKYGDTCHILSEYLSILDKYRAIYGKKCIVLYQNGLFFEFYGVDNDEETLGDTKEMSKILGLQLTRKNKSILENNRKNFLLVGFNIQFIEKYITILVEEHKYTCVIVEQDESVVVNSGENKCRRVTGIVGPSTNIKYNVKPNNNYLVCLYFQKEKNNNILPSLINGNTFSTKSNESNKFNLFSVGMTSIDLSTGELICYETHNTNDDENIIFDETNRFISTMNPSEIIIYIDESYKDIIYENIDLSGNIRIHEYDIKNIQKDYFRNSFQNQYLQKIYPNCGLLDPIEYLDLEKSPQLVICLILCIQFCYNQNENIIKNIEPPQIWNYKKYLILDNNAISQLNIIEKDSECLLNIVDKTSTSMGKRYLRHRLTLPYIDENILNESYNVIEDMRQIISQNGYANNIHNNDKNINDNENKNIYEYHRVENVLNDIIDVERYHRKISLNIINHNEYITLQNTYKKILELINITKNYRSSWKECELNDMYDYINNIIGFIKDINIDSETDSIFKTGTYVELDIMSDTIKSMNNTLNNLVKEINSFIGNENTYVQIKNTKDDDGNVINYLLCTKNRWNTFIKKLKESKKNIYLNSNIHTSSLSLKMSKKNTKNDNIHDNPDNNDNPDIINPDDWYSINERDSKDIKVTCKAFSNFCDQLENKKKELKKLNDKYFIDFLKPIWEKYSDTMYNIVQYISEIDFYKSSAKCSILYNYCKPKIISYNNTYNTYTHISNNKVELEVDTYNKSYIIAKKLRHALIERLQRKISYVAQDVNLKDERQMLLFGVNCSGKSSYMRAVGVSVIMAQSGMYVPAESFEICPYEIILTRIVGNDNIKNGKSTFAVEMGELRGILKRANNRSLILGDEVCHGTETISAVSILSTSLIKLNDTCCNSIFTTHLHPVTGIKDIKLLEGEGKLGMYHFKVKNLNGILIYDRKLESGSGNTLYGLEVAKAMNFKYDFIDMANKIRKEILEVEPIFTVNRSNYNKDLYVDKCSTCNEKAVDTHHIKFQSCADNTGYIDYLQKDHMSNLVALCKSCHQKVHSSPPKLQINGYIQSTLGITLDYKYL